jgi:ABC-type lipoprotein export system ATPase subunit
MNEAVFTAKGLTKTYVSGEVTVRALNQVDLEIVEKEVVVLLGPSGSGKTTLLNIMGGLDRPTSGRLFFRDLDLTDLQDRELTKYRRDHVGFVFQFYNLVPSLTAYENVALGHGGGQESDAAGRRPRAGRARGADASLPGAAIRRRAAARGHCTRDSKASGGAALRRANRGA